MTISRSEQYRSGDDYYKNNGNFFSFIYFFSTIDRRVELRYVLPIKYFTDSQDHNGPKFIMIFSR